MDPKQLNRFIESTLWKELTLKYVSYSANCQLLMTAAVESNCGQLLYQYDDGPARGIFQIEPNTERLVWKWCVENDEILFNALVRTNTSGVFGGVDLVGNLKYQVILARANYWAWPYPLPIVSNPITDEQIENLAVYWKRYWNTYAGEGSVPEAVEKYKKYVGYYL